MSTTLHACPPHRNRLDCPTGHLNLVPKLACSAVIPRGVATEIVAGPADDPAPLFLAQPSWLSIVDLEPILSPLAKWKLGRGESEVLEYARRKPGTVAVLDDKAARRAALALNVPITGTLGLLVAAKRHKLISSMNDAIKTVLASGLHVDAAIATALISEMD